MRLGQTSLQEMLRTSGVAQFAHMRQIIAQQHRSIEEVKEVLFLIFQYRLLPDGEWEKLAQAPIGFYDLTFSDETFHHQYWDFDQQESITFDQAKERLDLSRLSADSLKLFERTAPAPDIQKEAIG